MSNPVLSDDSSTSCLSFIFTNSQHYFIMKQNLQQNKNLISGLFLSSHVGDLEGGKWQFKHNELRLGDTVGHQMSSNHGNQFLQVVRSHPEKKIFTCQ